MENVNGLSLDLIIHPGETIKEILIDRNITQEELAIRTCFTPKHISEVISGKKDISSNFANCLEYALNIPTSFWVNLQGIYDKEIIELRKLNNVKEEEFCILKELKDIIVFCKNHNIIEETPNKSLMVLNLRRFLNVNDLTTIPSLELQQTAFRGSKKTKVNINVLYSWKKICEYFTDKIIVNNKLDKEKLKSKINDIKKTMFLEPNDMVKELQSIFLECGIVFKVVKHFTGAPVQGYIHKKNNKIVLCMTIRKSFSDIFWFTLFHEIAHILNEDFKVQYIDYTFIENESEIKADQFARNTLIDFNDYENFKKQCRYDLESINEFANKQGVVPGIVIGRIQNDTGNYRFMSKMREQYKWKNN